MTEYTHMELSFYARGGIAVAVPGQVRPAGSGGEPFASGPPAKYIGREFVPPVGLRMRKGQTECTEPAKYIVSSKPFRCGSESRVGKRLVRHMTRTRCRRTGEYPLWPADVATAKFLGVPYVEVSVVDGNAVPAPTTAAATKRANR